MYNWKHECNLGTLFRSSLAFDANFIFTIGRRYKRQASDTCNSIDQIPYFSYLTIKDFIDHIPKSCLPICIEIKEDGISLEKFNHPKNAIYILGNEVTGISKELTNRFTCVTIPSKICLNVSTAGSIVLWDRILKEKNATTVCNNNRLV